MIWLRVYMELYEYTDNDMIKDIYICLSDTFYI